MRFQVILNRDGGTFRTLDLDGFAEYTKQTLEQAGHDVEIVTTAGDRVEAALDAAHDSPCDVVMIGGGDGSASTAAARFKDSEKALAILPAGTMNLFARALGIPLRLEDAVAAFATGDERVVDVATADGRVFVHQFSVGLHAKLIRLREKKQTFGSRLGKIWASVRAGMGTFLRPPRIRVEIDIDGTRHRLTTAGIGISNNLFGEGHLPYTDTPDGGVLGVYVTRARRRRDLALLAARLLIGRWHGNDKVVIHPARTVRLTILSEHERFGCAIDGELSDLQPETVLQIHPGSLKVIVPARG